MAAILAAGWFVSPAAAEPAQKEDKAAVAAPPEGQVAPARPLFERLGGILPITLVVDDFIDRLLSNETLNANPKIVEGRDRSPAAYLKFQVANLVCLVTGGPCIYTGKSMKDSHVNLNITELEWQAMLVEFGKSLDKFKVPDNERKDLVAFV
ncbi:MAG: group 1 truncated hemoglobin, partial [Elusimicrobia bacterium]|nr:group 1 truncated hemoglobin [Elusimicrobiota bacterium]